MEGRGVLCSNLTMRKRNTTGGEKPVDEPLSQSPRAALRSSDASRPSPPKLVRWTARPAVFAVCYVVGFALRYQESKGAATRPMHPDAVHQGPEIAHLWAYGSGECARKHRTNRTDCRFSWCAA
jgi:hypothetical protein